MRLFLYITLIKLALVSGRVTLILLPHCLAVLLSCIAYLHCTIAYDAWGEFVANKLFSAEKCFLLIRHVMCHRVRLIPSLLADDQQ